MATLQPVNASRPTLLKRVPPPVLDELAQPPSQPAKAERAGSPGAHSGGVGGVPSGSKTAKEPSSRTAKRETGSPVLEGRARTASQTAGAEPAGSPGAHSGVGGVEGRSKALKEPATKTGLREASGPVLEGRARPASQTARAEPAPSSGASRRSHNGAGGLESRSKAPKEPAARTGERGADAGARTDGRASEGGGARGAVGGAGKEGARRVTCEEILSRYCDRFMFELAQVARNNETGATGANGKQKAVFVKIAGRLVGIGTGQTTFEAIVDGYEDTVKYLFSKDKMLRKLLVHKDEFVAWRVVSPKQQRSW